jgi:DNA repair exonuclease SbcCD ATPase subunit
MVLNIITLSICLLMLIIFRRFDKSNMRLAKLRRYATRVYDEFKKMTESESRKFNDATIEMDILIKKSNTLTKNLQSSLIEIENRLKGLDIEKTNLRKVEDDLKVVSLAARDVNEQMKFISETKSEFSDITKRIHVLSDSMKKMQGDQNDMTINFNLKIKDKSKELLDEFQREIKKLHNDLMDSEDKMVHESEQKISSLTENFSISINGMEQKLNDSGEMMLDNLKMKVDSVAKTIEGAQNLNNQVKGLRDILENLEEKVFHDIREKTNDIKQDMSRSLTEFNDHKADLYDKVEGEVNKVQEKLSLVENSINESKIKLIKSFEEETVKIRTELDNLNIHAVSKKDEIVQATRKEAEEISQKIDNFEEKFHKLENRLISTAEEKVNHLGEEYKAIETRFNMLSEKLDAYENEMTDSITIEVSSVKKEFSIMDQRLTEIKNEIIDYEERSRIFTRTDEMMSNVDKSIAEFNRMLRESQNGIKVMDKFFDDIDNLKEIKKLLDKEIRDYQTKRDKLFDIDSQIRGLMEFSELVIAKMDNLKDQSAKVDTVNTKIDTLAESYSDLESRIRELHDYESLIAKNLESANRSELVIKTIEGKMKSFQNIIDRSDKRIDKLTQHLQNIEESTLILKSKEGDIQEVKDRFNELEGLTAHIEKRIEQIHAMFQKVETLRKDVDDSDNRLQDIIHETDKRMKQFADFIQVVDKNNPIIKQVNREITAQKNLNKGQVSSIRDLYNKGWTPEDISKKLLIDENSVRFVINTISL